MKYNGLPINEGIVIGRIRKMSAAGPGDAGPGPVDADVERMRFFDALLDFEGNMKAVASSAPSQEGRDIISGQIMIARDPALSDEVISLIDSGMSADAALLSACRKYEAMLDSLEDEMISERLEDLLEVRNGILALMGGVLTDGDEAENAEGDVYIADRIAAAQLVGLKEAGIRAVVMRSGTAASHAAVILRSMGITSVFGVNFDPEDIEDLKEVIVDGCEGIVVTDPSDDLKKEYIRKASDLRSREESEPQSIDKCVTSDGKRVQILSNIGSETVPDIASLSDGAGLVRTEFLFLGENETPGEDEQTLVYEKIADSFDGREIVIRTLDIGGDKYLSPEEDEDPAEDNPALSIRGVRLSLMKREAFSHQICAILRASAGRKVSMMIPMVTSVTEIEQVRRLIEGCKSMLRGKGISYSNDIRLGCMIETPAAVLCAGEIAHLVDFFSIGTNDLSQYIMCADRGNPHLADLCSAYQPAVIRAVRIVCDKASAAGIPVTVCGEAASDAALLPVFLGLGVESLSVEPSRIPAMKNAVRRLDMSECKKTALSVLNAGSEEEVRKILKG
ncbi:MAG: phosphoenolpyruvate--protein phosphotransferase [Lachnospiraceae bacterium]|nr:phosphoenolpyruvate--protein phosphotransferase [Lachnospiraceae bacterium]